MAKDAYLELLRAIDRENTRRQHAAEIRAGLRKPRKQRGWKKARAKKAIAEDLAAHQKRLAEERAAEEKKQ